MEKKILIVDDEKAIVDILNYNLSNEGYKTVEAYDGEQAIEMAEKEKPDLILLDVMLPKKDGFSVCKEIRQKNNIPIIMVTARSQLEDKAIGEETGVNEYITKPFELDAIVKKVEEYLGTNE